MSKTIKRCMETSEKENKKRYIGACLKQCWHFTPFVVSLYGLLGVEVEETLKCIVIRLTINRKKPYSQICAYVKSRVAITLVRVVHCCIQGGGGKASGLSNHHETPPVLGRRGPKPL